MNKIILKKISQHCRGLYGAPSVVFSIIAAAPIGTPIKQKTKRMHQRRYKLILKIRQKKLWLMLFPLLLIMEKGLTKIGFVKNRF